MKSKYLLSFVIFSLLCLCLFFSCNKSLEGQGGFESLRAPVSYEDMNSTESVIEEIPQLEYSVYRIRQGDMISVIAKNFGITEDSIISVNGVTQSRYIQIGQYLKIPSMPGIMYTVRKDGETVNSIAAKYEIPVEKCSTVNNIEQNVALTSGTSLFLPDAKLDWVTRQEINGDLFTRPLRSRRYYFSSYYGWRNSPFTGKRSFHGGIDMACSSGTPIYAALSGRVSRVGSDSVYGNYVEITHHSGYKTLYAHMSKVNTTKGAYVNTSSLIGYVGSTGMSTGPHLHFAVYKNGKSLNPQTLWK